MGEKGRPRNEAATDVHPGSVSVAAGPVGAPPNPAAAHAVLGSRGELPPGEKGRGDAPPSIPPS